MLSVYTPQITNRLKYAFDLVFKEALGIPYKLTDNKDEFTHLEGPKICYDHQTIPEVLCFGAVYLLFEKGVKEQDIHMHEYEGLKIFYCLNSENYCLPFDPFAACFYLVSRYEEYLPHMKDHFGRFPAKESIAYKHNFLEKPVVNNYIRLVRQKLLENFPEMKFNEPTYRFLPTYDIDSAFAYLNKGLIRNLGGLLHSLVNLDLQSVKDRLMVVSKLKKDPFDTYALLEDMHRKYDLRPVYFFLVGDYDEYDKNISINISQFQELIKSIADYYHVGIHPSFASNEKPEKLTKEIAELSSVLKREIKKSRQHFLKLELPVTYQRLLDNDITEDYSMGYASHPGFRAGICIPFYFYNLETENKTNLRVFPFAVMDATFNYYLSLSPHQIPDAITPIINEVKKVNGTFISLWHNSSLSEDKEWIGWRKVYQDMVTCALK